MALGQCSCTSFVVHIQSCHDTENNLVTSILNSFSLLEAITRIMDHSHYPDSECLQLADSERPLPALPEPVSVSLEKESTTANLYGNDEKEFTEIREGFPRSLRMSTAKTSISTQRPTREPRICGLRKRIFWIMLGSLCLLVITTALASVIGVLSSRLSARAR